MLIICLGMLRYEVGATAEDLPIEDQTNHIRLGTDLFIL